MTFTRPLHRLLRYDKWGYSTGLCEDSRGLRNPFAPWMPPMHRWDCVNGGTRRAPRFPFAFPLLFKVPGESVWHDARGVNISRSGILFDPAGAIEPRIRIAVRFEVPIPFTGRPGALVVCRGHVARQAIDPNGRLLVAATIDSYRFHRQQDAAAHAGTTSGSTMVPP